MPVVLLTRILEFERLLDVPMTANFCPGELVPMPRLPEESRRIRSAEAVPNAKVLSAGLKINASVAAGADVFDRNL